MGECLITRRGGESYKLPVLNSSYPMNQTVIVGTDASFSVKIDTHGNPAEYRYQWYVNGSAVNGATGTDYTKSNVSKGTYIIYCAVTNKAGTVQSRTATLIGYSMIPDFTYDGAYELVDDDGNKIAFSSNNWRIRFLTSGTLRFTALNGATNGIDVFCCGGGGGGGASIAGGGGGGGYTATVKNKTVELNTDYIITIGSGGGNNVNGGNTTAFNVTANGGNPGGWYSTSTGSATGGAGGSGGGQYGGTSGGSDGGNGGGKYGGKGQGATTREFGESSGRLYAGGGSGGVNNSGDTSKWIPAVDETAAGSAQHAPANRGGGGGGSCHTLGPAGGSGGSGIVVIRNKR